MHDSSCKTQCQAGPPAKQHREHGEIIGLSGFKQDYGSDMQHNYGDLGAVPDEQARRSYVTKAVQWQ